MRILLTSSNLNSQFPRCFPNATAALSAFLKREGYDVRMLHLARRRDLAVVPKVLAEYRPDVVGCSAVTCEAPVLSEISRLVKDWQREVPVVCGGTHIIVNPLPVLQLDTVDAICHGEGELAFLEYLQKVESGKDVTDTRNFWFKRNGKVVKNQPRPFLDDLDSLPYPDRTQADLQKTINANNYVLNMQLGRGCNWNCRFCCNGDIRKANTGTYVRNRSVQGSIGELVEIARNFRFRCITIRDDNFAFNRQWALDFCREYPKHIRQPFEVFSRVDCLDEEVIAGLKAAGCLSVFLGLDSGHDYIRNEVLHKEQTNDDLRRVSAQLKAAGIRPVLSNIVGLPYETLEMHQQTIALNREIYSEGPYFSPSFGVTPKIWVFDPWPGTDLYKVCKKEGWLESDDRKHKVYRQSCLNMPQFRPEAIHHAYRTFRWRVFKDRYPVKALMLRIYDTRLAEEIMERLPLEYVGVVREALLRLMNKGVRRFFARKAPAALRSKPSAA